MMIGSIDDWVARLRRNPADYEAFSALQSYYRQIQDYASLASLLEAWGAHCPDPHLAAATYLEAADLVLSVFGDRMRFVSLYENALSRNPMHLDAAHRLEATYEQLGDLGRLVDWLQRRVEALTAAQFDPQEIARLHEKLGVLWGERLQHPERALFHLGRAIDLDRTRIRAIHTAREMNKRARNIPAVISFYQLEVDAEPDPIRKASILLELSQYHSEQLGDIDQAILALERARLFLPEDLGILHPLATLLLKKADALGQTPDAESCRHRAADVLVMMTAKAPMDHAIAYAEAALDAVAAHKEALLALEKLAVQAGRESVLPLRWIGFLRADPESPYATTVRHKLAKAYQGAGQIDDAIACLEPLLEQRDPQAAEVLADLYQAAGRQDAVARARAVALSSLPPDQRLSRLRQLVHSLALQGKSQEAAEYAREILEIEPGDPEAQSFLEDHFRAAGDYTRLRELFLTMARVPTLSVDAKKQRLREAAILSEEKLGDIEGAINAWRTMTALDPTDAAAQTSYRRLLESAERWDDIVNILESEALSAIGVDAKAEAYERLAEIHRTRRGDLLRAVAAYRQLRKLRPQDARVRDAFCETLLEANEYPEAVPLLEERIAAQKDSKERMRLLHVLANALESGGEPDKAFQVCARILDEDHADQDALDRMERIDEHAGRFDRLLQTLSYRADESADAQRAQVLERMGDVCDTYLHDLDRALEYYMSALDMARENIGILSKLCHVYERAGRERELVTLLGKRAESISDLRIKAEYYRRMARVLSKRVKKEDAAQSAWLTVLEAGEDEEALRSLATIARRRDARDELEQLLSRLAAAISNMDKRREVLVERAALLAYELERTTDAIQVLKEAQLDREPAHREGLDQLATLSESAGDAVGMVDALEKLLAASRSLSDAAPSVAEISERLANAYERVLDDPEHAIVALFSWASADPGNPAPRHRLVPLLEKAQRWSEFVSNADGLFLIEAVTEENEASFAELSCKAADVSFRKLGDAEGAWQRLQDRARFHAGSYEFNESGDASEPYKGPGAVQRALFQLAHELGRGRELAEFFVGEAQAAAKPTRAAQDWAAASLAYEKELNDAPNALEAMLRALANDLVNERLLAESERLTEIVGAWPRLERVYDTLLRAADTERKIQLLLRYSEVLESKAKDRQAAFEKVLQAATWIAARLHESADARLVEDEVRVLDRIETLASERGAEVLTLYRQLSDAALSIDAKMDVLLRAVSFAHRVLSDREQAESSLSRAVDLSTEKPELGERLESLASELDKTSEQSEHEYTRALANLYLERAEEAHRNHSDSSEAGVDHSGEVILRGARVLEKLGDAEGAFNAVKRAAEVGATRSDLLRTLKDMAEQLGRLADFVRHLDRVVDEIVDSDLAAQLLRTQARLFEDELQDPAGAAGAYGRLFRIRPSDADAASQWCDALRRAAKYRDLLLALDQVVEGTQDKSRKIRLLKEMASTWEEQLSNPFEALDVWKKIAKLDPENSEAEQQQARLQKLNRRDGDVLAELSEAPVITAEDLAIGLAKEGSETDGEASPSEPDTMAPVGSEPSEPEAVEEKSEPRSNDVTDAKLEE